ncbi:MAG: hypothetical protein V3T77_00770 [Planctomycetota bacterium]
MESSPPPPLPRPSFEDPLLAQQYGEALALLEKHDYKKARGLLRRLKGKAPKGESQSAVKRCLLEAEGGLELEKITDRVGDGKLRWASARLEKLERKYQGTFAGQELVKIHKQVLEELYFVVADFEKKQTATPPEEKSNGEVQEAAKEREDYGEGTRIIQGTPEEGSVRHGKRALRWRTSALMTTISFPEVKEKSSQYRYLNLSLRSQDSKRRPQLVLLFDCREMRNQGGGGRRGGGRRGAGRVFQREGYHYSVTPTEKWQDLRLDLQKFTRKGEVTWEDVVALRIIHMPGVEGVIILDDIRLEKK